MRILLGLEVAVLSNTGQPEADLSANRIGSCRPLARDRLESYPTRGGCISRARLRQRMLDHMLSWFVLRWREDLFDARCS